MAGKGYKKCTVVKWYSTLYGHTLKLNLLLN